MYTYGIKKSTNLISFSYLPNTKAQKLFIAKWKYFYISSYGIQGRVRTCGILKNYRIKYATKRNKNSNIKMLTCIFQKTFMAINKVKQNEKYLQAYPAHRVLGTGYVFPLFL